MLNDSYYLFVEVAAQRCSQLMRGAKPKVELRAHKYSTVACAEVREDLVPWEMATDEQLAAELAAAVDTEEARDRVVALLRQRGSAGRFYAIRALLLFAPIKPVRLDPR